jgi:VWFA-related protein
VRNVRPAFLLLLTLSLSAQTRESIEVRVTELEVTVLDRNGHPVEGLGRDDFELRIGGKVTPISNFFAVRRGVVVDDEKTANEPARALSAQTSIPTTLIIFLDEVHLRHTSRKRALEALQRYVAANVGPLTTATLIRYNKHLDVRTRPTERPGYIIAELEKLKRESFLGHDGDRERQVIIEQIDGILFQSGMAAGIGGESQDTIFYRVETYAERVTGDVDRSLDALESAIELASGFEGRKVLLYVSEGIPQQPGAELFEYWDRALRNAPVADMKVQTGKLDISRAARFDRTPHLRRVAEAAQKARVAIYAFDAAGVRPLEGTSVEQMSSVRQINTSLMQSNLRGSLQYVAEETGGRYVGNENDIDKVLMKMSEQFSTYYSLGFRRPKGTRPGRMQVSVKNRHDVRVITSRPHPPRTRQEEIESNIRARLYTRASVNPLSAKVEVSKPSLVAGQCIVNVRLSTPTIPPELRPEAMELHFVLINERNDESELRSAVLPLQSGRLTHSMTLRIQPRPHVLSLALANPLSGETSYLQGDLDASNCRDTLAQ